MKHKQTKINISLFLISIGILSTFTPVTSVAPVTSSVSILTIGGTSREVVLPANSTIAELCEGLVAEDQMKQGPIESILRSRYSVLFQGQQLFPQDPVPPEVLAGANLELIINHSAFENCQNLIATIFDEIQAQGLLSDVALFSILPELLQRANLTFTSRTEENLTQSYEIYFTRLIGQWHLDYPTPGNKIWITSGLVRLEINVSSLGDLKLDLTHKFGEATVTSLKLDTSNNTLRQERDNVEQTFALPAPYEEVSALIPELSNAINLLIKLTESDPIKAYMHQSQYEGRDITTIRFAPGAVYSVCSIPHQPDTHDDL